MKNPHFVKLVEKMLDQKLKERDQTISSKNNTPEKAGKETHQVLSRVVKSPSDTTLYKPAFKLVDTEQNSETNRFLIEQQRMESDQQQPDVINEISNFVDAMRVQHDSHEQDQRAVVLQQKENDELKEAMDRANKSVIEAEKFKATLAEPKDRSNVSQMIGNILEAQEHPIMVTENLSDDDFFHLTCHIDSTLRSKIEKGEYVDLEKLLPKERGASFGTTDENRLEWVQKDGLTFLAPAAARTVKINGISNGNRHSEFMLQFIVVQIPVELRRFGSIFML